VGIDGVVHVVYYKGETKAGDLFYVRREKPGSEFGAPVRVNSEAGSAASIGTIRGAQMALGKGDRVHVVWNGSGRRPDGTTDHENCPVMYARWVAANGAFEPERNLMTRTTLLDGGCAVAADLAGRVTVAWHAVDSGSKGRREEDRHIFVAVSEKDGDSFAPEIPVTTEGGVCACCSMAAFAEGDCGRVDLLFRGAANGSERGMVLLRSDCAGGEKAAYKRTALQEWRIQACPMSSAAFAAQPSTAGPMDPRMVWETEGQVWLATLSTLHGSVSTPVAPAGNSAKRKHPRVAVNRKGETLMVWTEGTGWNKGGSLAWQVFDAANKPIDGARGTQQGVPVWSFAAAVALPDGGFEILY
jgi:hypothetical protein